MNFRIFAAACAGISLLAFVAAGPAAADVQTEPLAQCCEQDQCCNNGNGNGNCGNGNGNGNGNCCGTESEVRGFDFNVGSSGRWR